MWCTSKIKIYKNLLMVSQEQVKMQGWEEVELSVADGQKAE